MKFKWIAALAFFFIVVKGMGQANDLMIVEYADWNSGGGLMVEIYNPTCDTIDLTDYKLAIYENGSTNPFGGTGYSFLGTLAPKASLVVRNRVTSPASFTSCYKDTVMNLLGLTGNAALVLSKGSSLTNFVDMVGAYNFNLCSVIPGGCASVPEPTPKTGGVNQALFLNRIVRDTNNLIRYTSTDGVSPNSWPHDTSTNLPGWTVGGPGTCIVKGFNAFVPPQNPEIKGAPNREVCKGIDSVYEVIAGNGGSKFKWELRSAIGSTINGSDSSATVTIGFSNATGYDTLVVFEYTSCATGGQVLSDTIVIEIKDCGKGCVVINEVMVQPLVANNDSNGFAGEWIELFNTCCDTVDIGCYRISSGDWALTIPQNTILMPFSFYTIGSDSLNNGIPDLNITNCNCIGTSNPNPALGALPDGAGQLVLYNEIGILHDAIVWGGGQGLPTTQPAPLVGACVAKTINLPTNTGTTYQNIGAISAGASKARKADGDSVWVDKTGGDITLKKSNNDSLVTVTILSSLYDTLYACGQQYIVVAQHTGAGMPTWILQNGGVTGTTYAASSGGDTITVTAGNTQGVDTFIVSKINPLCNTVYDTVFRVQQPCKCTWITNPSADTAVCINNPVQLQSNVVTNWFYLQNSTQVSFASNTTNTIRTSAFATTDTILVVHNSCPDTVLIKFNGLPTINNLADTAACLGDTVAITPTISTGTTFRWLPTTGLYDSTLIHPKVSPNATTQYKLFITDTVSGCSAADSFVFDVNTKPTISNLVDTFACFGDTARIQPIISAGATFKWLPTTGLYDSTLINPKVSPTNTTQYKLLLTNAGGCSSADSFIFTVHPKPTITGLVNTSICMGDSVLLTPTYTNTNTVNWLPAVGLSCTNCLQPYAKPTVTTMYTLDAISVNNCIVSQSVTVNVTATPTVSISKNDTICAGESRTLTASGGNRYIWSTGDTIPSIVVQPTTNTYYSARTANASCFSQPDSVLIVISPTPNASFVANPTSGSVPLDVVFKNTSTQATSYQWIDDNLVFSTDREPSYTINDTGSFTITLIALNSNGCTDTFTFTINVLPDVYINIPNVFTPNGDSLNDYFEASLSGILSLEGSIYNRWGEQMHAFKYPSSSSRWWDGNYSGQPCPQGVYFCVISYLDAKGEKHNYSGSLTLLR